MVFPFEKSYEITYYNCAICNCFCEGVKQNLELKFWKKSWKSFKANLEKQPDFS